MADNIVQTKSGAVRGTSSEGVLAFKGIPYAAPPFGANRFKPPQPVTAWDGVRDATQYGATCPKPPYAPPMDAILPEPVIPGEDCLNLNVWTPETGGTKLPVMVWIHGGAFRNGSGAVDIYDGSRFARDGVVCVTINYRLGAEGFLYLGEGVSNLGMQDQIAALEWVQANISAFGGDPANVTIFGESAGGMSVGTLLAMPRAKGLFRRAIPQSGAGHHVLTAGTAQKIGQYLAEKVGVAPTFEAFATVPPEQLIVAQSELAAEVLTNPDPARWGEVVVNAMPFEPVIDGVLLTGRPIDLIAAGASADVDILTGSTTEEYRLFTVPSGIVDFISQEMLNGIIAAYRLPVEDALATYRAVNSSASPGDLQAAIATDWFFRIPAIRLLEAHTKGSGANYLYEFAWRSPQFGGRLGACHALEIAFAFDNLDRVGNTPIAGDNPPQQLAAAMHRAWVQFAKTGNPGWPQYDTTTRAIMVFNDDSAVINDLRPAQRALWEGVR